MPLFVVPFTPSSEAPQSRARFSSLPAPKKRKRADSSPPESESDDDAKTQASRSDVAASTNPLSLTPAEVVQYRLAGLELDEEIPNVKGWPHRGLPPEWTDIARNARVDVKGKGKEVIQGASYGDENMGDGVDSRREIEVQNEERRREEALPRLRMQHLAVLTAILHRCLLEGDIPRASRAWAMLIRAQVGGRGIDLKSTGYWAIGAELLIRSGEKPALRRRPSQGAADMDFEDDPDPQPEQEAGQPGGMRYGTAAGLEKAKEYYQRLILTMPYIRWRPNNISALDFWPAMVGCEIYGIQYEQKESLRKLALHEENEDQDQGEDEDAMASHSDSGSEISDGEDDDFYAIEQRRKARKRQKRTEKAWQERDQIRKTALEAYEKVAARLDEVMQGLPYMDNQALLRLRGMLALCIGDLMVPALPDNGEEGYDEEHLERDGRLGKKDTERRFLYRQRIADYERGKKKQREQQARARVLFERIERTSGRKEAVTDFLAHEERTREQS